MITVCAWCGRTRDPETGEWVAGGVDERRCTHGICPPCYHSLDSESTDPPSPPEPPEGQTGLFDPAITRT